MPEKFKFLILGILIGIALSGGIAWAATRICIVDDNNNVLGTTDNPLYVISP